MATTISKYNSDIFLRVFDRDQGTAMIGQGAMNFGVEALHIPTRITVRCSSSNNVHLNQQQAIRVLNEQILKHREEDDAGVNKG
jgi:protein subunit release factor A